MGVCIVINGLVVKARNRRGESETTTMRSVGAVWTCAGVTVVLVAVGAVWSGMVEFRCVLCGPVRTGSRGTRSEQPDPAMVASISGGTGVVGGECDGVRGAGRTAAGTRGVGAYFG